MKVTQSCVVHEILQARILEWVIFSFSRGSSQPRDQILQADSLPAEPQGKPKNTGVVSLSLLQGIFLTQESPALQADSFPTEHLEKPISIYWGHARASLVVQMAKNLPAMQETQVWSLGWEDPLENGMATHCAYCLPSSEIIWWGTVPPLSFRFTVYYHWLGSANISEGQHRVLLWFMKIKNVLKVKYLI